VHRPNTDTHRGGTARKPSESSSPAGGCDPSREIERRIRSANGDEYRQNYQAIIVRTDHRFLASDRGQFFADCAFP